MTKVWGRHGFCSFSRQKSYKDKEILYWHKNRRKSIKNGLKARASAALGVVDVVARTTLFGLMAIPYALEGTVSGIALAIADRNPKYIPAGLLAGFSCLAEGASTFIIGAGLTLEKVVSIASPELVDHFFDPDYADRLPDFLLNLMADTGHYLVEYR